MSTRKADTHVEAAEAASTLPDFQPDALYDVQLNRAVEFPPGSQNFLRPSESHQINGALCLQWKDAISGAVAVEEPGQA